MFLLKPSKELENRLISPGNNVNEGNLQKENQKKNNPHLHRRQSFTSKEAEVIGGEGN